MKCEHDGSRIGVEATVISEEESEAFRRMLDANPWAAKTMGYWVGHLPVETDPFQRGLMYAANSILTTLWQDHLPKGALLPLTHRFYRF